MNNSSLELFQKFQRRFREISWHGAGFVTELNPKPLGNEIRGNENLQLFPGFVGRKNHIPVQGRTSDGAYYDTWWSVGGHSASGPSFHIRKAKLSFKFTFNPSDPIEIQEQLEKAAMRAILDGPLKGRRFLVDYHFPESFEKLKLRGCPRADFSIEGPPVRGLSLESLICHDWTFFIPKGPERAMIQASLDLEDELRKDEQDERMVARFIMQMSDLSAKIM